MEWLFAFFVLILFSFSILVHLGQKAAKVDWGGKRVNWMDGLVRLLCRHVHRLPDTIIPLPETGPAIVVANHISGLDPMLLVAASHRPLRFLIAREEYERSGLHWLFKKMGCIPVDRTGKPEQALRQALRALQQGEVLALFPHGKIHLDSDPPRKIKGGVARLASWTHAPVFPVRIDGVGGEGQVALAPFIPSNVQISVAPEFFCKPDDVAECLDHITRMIEAPNSP